MTADKGDFTAEQVAREAEADAAQTVMLRRYIAEQHLQGPCLEDSIEADKANGSEF